MVTAIASEPKKVYVVVLPMPWSRVKLDVAVEDRTLAANIMPPLRLMPNPLVPGCDAFLPLFAEIEAATNFRDKYAPKARIITVVLQSGEGIE